MELSAANDDITEMKMFNKGQSPLHSSYSSSMLVVCSR